MFIGRFAIVAVVHPQHADIRLYLRGEMQNHRLIRPKIRRHNRATAALYMIASRGATRRTASRQASRSSGLHALCSWLQRVTELYENSVWLHHIAERYWEHTPSLQIIKQIFADRMFPLTLDGLDHAMRELSRG